MSDAPDTPLIWPTKMISPEQVISQVAQHPITFEVTLTLTGDTRNGEDEAGREIAGIPVYSIRCALPGCRIGLANWQFPHMRPGAVHRQDLIAGPVTLLGLATDILRHQVTAHPKEEPSDG